VAKFKVWHPDGESHEIMGELRILTSQCGLHTILAIQMVHPVTSSVPGYQGDRWVPGVLCPINPLCVIVDMKSDKICHHPRRPLNEQLMSDPAWEWLRDNPTWPNVLELDWEKMWRKEDWE